MSHFLQSLLLAALVLIAYSYGNLLHRHRRQAEEGLLIGGFNIKAFGKTKYSKPDVVAHLVNIVRRYDLVMIQEYRDKSQTVIANFLRDVNNGIPSEEQYEMKVGPRVGRSSRYKEQYVYMYRKHKLEVLSDYTFDDGPETSAKTDLFEREPYTVLFKSSVTGLNKFFCVGIHIKPSDAFKEINYLDDAYYDAVNRFGVQDGMILGDFNADCRYLSSAKRATNDLATKSEFQFLIHDDADTTVATSSCGYDRIVVAGTQMKNAVVPGSAGVFNFQEQYGMTQTQAKKVSDHFPVEARLR